MMKGVEEMKEGQVRQEVMQVELVQDVEDAREMEEDDGG